MLEPFRAFVSYSHQDQTLFKAIRASLVERGLDVTSDTQLRPGQGFTEQIQTSIAHAHVFIPILTPHSHERGWVHQEIGFAVALHVPCVPLGVGRLPDGMIAMSQALMIGDDLANLNRKILDVDFESLVEQAGRADAPPALVADEPQERSKAIADYCNEAHAARGACRVRVSGGLSSFSLPDEGPNHVAWRAAYGDRPRDAFAYRRSREEIVALKRHVWKGGLSMVVDVSLDLDTHRGKGVTRTRLCVLRDFLKAAQAAGASSHIAVVREHPPDLSLAVGDWFFARSRAPRVQTGVVHTTFSTHAPSISRRIAEFDANLESLVNGQGVALDDSTTDAVRLIEQRMNELPPHPAWPPSHTSP